MEYVYAKSHLTVLGACVLSGEPATPIPTAAGGPVPPVALTPALKQGLPRCRHAESPSPLPNTLITRSSRDESALSQLSPGKDFNSATLTSLTPSKEQYVLRRMQR